MEFALAMLMAVIHVLMIAWCLYSSIENFKDGRIFGGCINTALFIYWITSFIRYEVNIIPLLLR